MSPPQQTDSIDVLLAAALANLLGGGSERLTFRDQGAGTFAFDPTTGLPQTFTSDFGLTVRFDEEGRPFISTPGTTGEGEDVTDVTSRRYLTPGEWASISQKQPGAPTGRAPRAASTFIDQQGNLVGVDPVTGQERFSIPGAGPDAELQARRALEGELRDFQLDEISQQQRRQFEASQAGLTREQQARENALSRAQRASEFAATQELANRRFQLDFVQAQEQARRQQLQDRLGGARQFADLISLTDPAALPAFFEAGGGSISNALASGATALSENALLPAAQTLTALQRMNAPAPTAGFVGNFEAPVVNEARQLEGLNRVLGAILTGNPNQPAPGGFVGQQLAGLAATPGSAIVNNGGLFSAAPGTPGSQQGFQGALQGLPVIAAQAGFDDIVTGPTVFLAGEAGPERVDIDPMTRSNINRTRSIRQGVDTSEPMGIGPFNVRFSQLAPSLITRFLKARQAAFGLPVQDQLAEIQRFGLPGVSRNQVAAFI